MIEIEIGKMIEVKIGYENREKTMNETEGDKKK